MRLYGTVRVASVHTLLHCAVIVRVAMCLLDSGVSLASKVASESSDTEPPGLIGSSQSTNNVSSLTYSGT